MSGEPFAAWLTTEDALAWAWPHKAARRLAEKQDAALPGRVRDAWPAPAPEHPVGAEVLLGVEEELTRERRARVAAQLASMRDRRAFVPKGAGTASAVPLPGDEEAF